MELHSNSTSNATALNDMVYCDWLDSAGKEVGIALVTPLIAMVFIAITTARVIRQPVGSGKQVEIAQAIMEGSHAYMKRQYKIITIVTAICAVLIIVFLRTPINPFEGHRGGTLSSPYWTMCLHFILGALLSALSGIFGMNVAIRANVRTCHACDVSGLNQGLRVAFDSGTAMGMSVVSFVVFGQAMLYYIFEDILALSGFGFGASLVALFCRVGGGIFTKAADVGSDLVGKVEAGIPEDDPRNPGVIADNVGDNVGDVAGLGADLFESFVGATVASVPLGYHSLGRSGIALPFWISAAGIICSILGTFMVRTKDGASQADLLHSLRKGVWTSAFLIAVVSLPICLFLFANDTKIAWELYACNFLGLVSGMIVGSATEYTTSDAYAPVQSIVKAGRTGAATVIIQGLGVGMISTLVPGLVLGFTALICAAMRGPYGVSIAAIGMLSTLGITLATDAYGPVADNAGGIAEMAGLDERVRQRTDALDSLGNTTAATGKGFAIGSALLITLALISAFVAETRDDKGLPILLDMNDYFTLTGALIGALLPFLFAALTMFAVGRSAQAVIIEVRRQFRTIPGLLEGRPGVKPDNAICVDICTKAALKEMILPGIIAVVSPVAFGFTFGAKMLGGMLIGAILSGFFLGSMMANSGGAWDNAKKFVEASGSKGTALHKATVVGDTVGDPFKDTSGPALNILSKLMSHLSLIICGSLSYEMENVGIGIVIWLLVALGAGSTMWVYKYTDWIPKVEELEFTQDDEGELGDELGQHGSVSGSSSSSSSSSSSAGIRMEVDHTQVTDPNEAKKAEKRVMRSPLLMQDSV